MGKKGLEAGATNKGCIVKQITSVGTQSSVLWGSVGSRAGHTARGVMEPGFYALVPVSLCSSAA